MKNYLHLLLLLASMGVTAHELQKCGLDANPALTDEEAAFLNEYFSEQERNGFDFTGKKVLILAGPAATTLKSKDQFFKSITKRLEVSPLPIASQPYPLTREEKIQSGGYDVLLTLWNKVPFTAEKRQRIIRRIAQGIWQVPGA